MTEPPPGLTRRNFLKFLFTVGGGIAAAGLVRALRPDNTSPIYFEHIKNVIFFIQENHTFDSLFAGFPGANSQFAGQACADSLQRDPPHKHTDAFQPDGATTDEARCSYLEADAPNYWKMARAFTLCDNYFSDIRGPSYPN
jgi:phospholipase C